MNVVKLYAGLGNQMFQYAFGKLLESYNSEVIFEAGWYKFPRDPARPFGLNKFQTILPIFDFISGNVSIKEEDIAHYHYVPKYLKEKDVNFKGYWQNINYVLPVLEDLKQEFKVNLIYRTEQYYAIKAKILLDKNSVGLHVRRGDFITKEHHHHVLPLEYYRKALSYLSDKKGQLFVFSDDIKWCQTQFPDAVIVDMEDYLCLDLLRTCKHKIIANSTFSWWAAILGETENGITIAPSRWVLFDKQEEIIQTNKLIPSNWVRL